MNCLKCNHKLNGECGMDGCFFYCENPGCERYGLLVSDTIHRVKVNITEKPNE